MSSNTQLPEEVWVKTEPHWDDETSGDELRPPEPVLTGHVHVKVETDIKEEPEWEVAVTSGVAGLDANHEVMVGSESPQTPGASKVCLQVKKEEEFVKHETEWENNASLGIHFMSETDPLPGLYARHVVKDELVLGPVGVQPPDIMFTIRAAQALEQHAPRSTDAHWTEQEEGRHGGDGDMSSGAGPHLQRHDPTDTVTKPYLCDVCKKKFTTASNLKMHERVHTGERPHSCGTCQQKYTRLGDLKKHELIHTGEKPFACEICEQRFRQLSDLKRHERIHTGAKPYSCGVCGKMFRRLGDLQAHERIHAGEKRYFCKICNKNFTQSGTLRKHERTHTEVKPYSCDICGQKFKVKDSLKIHERTHTGEKPYECGICQKKFVTCSHLKRHERTAHAGDKP